MSDPIEMAAFLRGPWPERAAVLADLDGCLIAGDRVLPQVPELFDRCGARLWIVSNNSTDTAVGLSRRLAALGLDMPAARITLAGEETLRALAQDSPGARIALFAAPPLHDLARRLGLVPDMERAETVVLARDTGLTFAGLERMAALVHRGAGLRLTNPDPSHPGPDGAPVPETGAILAALSAVTVPGRLSCLGKPAPDLIRKTLARAGVLPAAAVYIGDTPATDGRAAAAAGVEFVQIAPPAAPARADARGEAAC